MNKIHLSYLLYNIDEVVYSFMLSLLFKNKHSLNESLFWAHELYVSKYDTYLWNFITKLYYDFYYIKNTSFEKQIDKEYYAWKSSNSFQHIAKIIKELHKQNIDTTIFELINNPKGILFRCDKEQLSRVFLNLIKNSIESIQQKPSNNRDFEKTISIEIKQDSDHINIVLIDNGIGFELDKNNIKNILNPYFTTKKNGTGLGLSIVNKIINDHNGSIDFISIKNGAKVEINFNLK